MRLKKSDEPSSKNKNYANYVGRIKKKNNINSMSGSDSVLLQEYRCREVVGLIWHFHSIAILDLLPVVTKI